MRDETLFLSSILREIPGSHLKLESVLYTLYATQEVPRDTHPHLQGTPSFTQQLMKSPVFPSSTQESIPLLRG